MWQKKAARVKACKDFKGKDATNSSARNILFLFFQITKNVTNLIN